MPGRKNPGRGRDRKRRQRVMSFLQPCLLFMLTRGAAHGYSLLNGIDEFGFDQDQFDVSLIYRALRYMEELGWVHSLWEDDHQGPRRRVYQILPEGETRLFEWSVELQRTRKDIDVFLHAYKYHQLSNIIR